MFTKYFWSACSADTSIVYKRVSACRQVKAYLQEWARGTTKNKQLKRYKLLASDKLIVYKIALGFHETLWTFVCCPSGTTCFFLSWPLLKKHISRIEIEHEGPATFRHKIGPATSGPFPCHLVWQLLISKESSNRLKIECNERYNAEPTDVAPIC